MNKLPLAGVCVCVCVRACLFERIIMLLWYEASGDRVMIPRMTDGGIAGVCVCVCV